MKTIIAGSREGVTLSDVRNAVDNAPWPIIEVISGTANGADTFGEIIAEEKGIPVKKFPANWKDISAPGAIIKYNSYGPYNANAGHLRNEKMAIYAEALIAVWDGKSKGTADIIKRAKNKKLAIFIYYV